MSRVLVVGGTGLAGRAVVAEAVARGHEVVVASRRVPAVSDAARVDGARYHAVDIVKASGFDEALEGVDVLIDTTNGMSRSSREVFTAGALNLVHAAARWGIERAVVLSIVNVDRSNYVYYRAKTAQEHVYRDSLLEARIVRATQFHDLVTSFFTAGVRLGMIPAFAGVRLQPIAVADVARILVDTAEGVGPANSTFTVGGPEVLTVRDMAASFKRAVGSRALIVRMPLPGALGALWRSGGALVIEHSVGEITYPQWLSEFAVASRSRRRGRSH